MLINFFSLTFFVYDVFPLLVFAPFFSFQTHTVYKKLRSRLDTEYFQLFLILPCKYYENLPDLYFNSKYQKNPCVNLKIFTRIVLPKFHENSILPWGVNVGSILRDRGESAGLK